MGSIRRVLIAAFSLSILLCACSKETQTPAETTSSDGGNTQSTLSYEEDVYSEPENDGKFRACLYFLRSDYSEIQGAVVMVKNGDSSAEYTTGPGGDVDIRGIDDTKETTVSVFDSADGKPIGSFRFTVARGEADAYENGKKDTDSQGTVIYTVKKDAGVVFSNLVLTENGTFESISIN